MMFDGRYVEEMWLRYLRDGEAVAPDWRNAFDFIRLFYGDPFSTEPARGLATDAPGPGEYLRRFGHLHARLDPLGLAPPARLPAGVAASNARAAVVEAYCGTMAVETGHIDDPAMRDWVVDAFERAQADRPAPDPAILDRLLETTTFDRFMAAKFPGKKRFGSEGADAVLPLLHEIERRAADAGVDEIILGSMHRGRMSILLNYAGMDAARLFAQFKGAHPFPDREDLPGDVPYHFGQERAGRGMRLTMLPNPSHLEAVNPLVAGFARARRADGSGRAMATILHTDASTVGQGVNAELLQLSALAGFAVGGTIHVVINNQVGFTTDPADARSSRYCTGPWRAVDSLLIHVNADDMDAVARSAALAVRFRERFARDAVIDLVCYRANGHNEIDEPRFTQPVYYRAADAKRDATDAYADRLIAAGTLSAADVEAARARILAGLADAYAAADGVADPPAPAPVPHAALAPDEDELRTIVAALAHVPDGAGAPKMVRLMARRLDELDTGVTWPLAEAMAFAAALRAGVPVRICGQDVERGPFSQRHLAAVHPETGERSYPMAALARDGAMLEVVNSPLSEYAVLGFEYGYSLGTRRTLCVWEAQFGDFANGAQIVIDQFIASGFEKWRQTSNLTVLLPHGLEGQGPEHSSARIERLLQLCARDNMRVCHPSTPANYYHLLRGQATDGDRPMFVITPKVLLRLPQARSPLADFVEGAGFRPVLVSPSERPARRAVLCSGKIAYELERARDERRAPVAIVRLEQFYPLDERALADAVAATGAREWLWLQEEPANFGAGNWLRARLEAVAAATGTTLLPAVARAEAASPAGSFHMRHGLDQDALIERAMGAER